MSILLIKCLRKSDANNRYLLIQPDFYRIPFIYYICHKNLREKNSGILEETHKIVTKK